MMYTYMYQPRHAWLMTTVRLVVLAYQYSSVSQTAASDIIQQIQLLSEFPYQR